MAGSKAEGYMSLKFAHEDAIKFRALAKYLSKNGRVTHRQLFALLIEKYIEVENIEVDEDGRFI